MVHSDNDSDFGPSNRTISWLIGTIVVYIRKTVIITESFCCVIALSGSCGIAQCSDPNLPICPPLLLTCQNRRLPGHQRRFILLIASFKTRSIVATQNWIRKLRHSLSWGPFRTVHTLNFSRTFTYFSRNFTFLGIFTHMYTSHIVVRACVFGGPFVVTAVCPYVSQSVEIRERGVGRAPARSILRQAVAVATAAWRPLSPPLPPTGQAGRQPGSPLREATTRRHLSITNMGAIMARIQTAEVTFENVTIFCSSKRAS